MTVSASQLSVAVSRALRHEPWVYELELDDEGWVSVDSLIVALRGQGPRWADVDRSSLEAMIRAAAKRRHEIAGERVRALYGHSLPGRLTKVEARPPQRLFHGTSPRAWEMIRSRGLHPMGRQFVHLSVDLETAAQVGRRKAREPKLLVIHSDAAHRAGVRFWVGNEVVWLAGVISAEFIKALS